MPTPQFVGEHTGLPAGDPPRIAVRVGDPAVKRAGQLERYPGRAFPDRPEKILIHRRRLVPQQSGCDIDARGLEAGGAFAVDERVRIADRGDNTGDAGIDDGIGAGRGPSLVAAGLRVT